jgi:hypothetical protein
VRTTLAPAHGSPDAQDLQPIRLFVAQMMLDALVHPGDERMTDVLNRGGELPVLPAGAHASEPENWMAVPIDELLMVVPPPHVSPPQKRAERERHQVWLRAGDWEVAGIAHLKPGAEQDAILLSTQPFLPLTGVTMRSNDYPQPETYDVVIVNLRFAEFVTD